jgi:DMSO/TMAO reductase YedYZ molybdopterin-dependent catalytic subunit
MSRCGLRSWRASTGVPLRSVLEAAGIHRSARFVQFYAYDDWADGIDMLDALHPQTILAYGMNGRDLPISHGAPLRARVETQLGYKSMTFLRRIVVTDIFDDNGSQGIFRMVGLGMQASESAVNGRGRRRRVRFWTDS